MTTSMQAVICEGPRDYRLDEIPVPRPGPGEALVKVEAGFRESISVLNVCL